MELLSLNDLKEIVLREFNIQQDDIRQELFATLTEPVIFDALKKNGIRVNELGYNRYTLG